MANAQTVIGNFLFPLKCVFCGEILSMGIETNAAICNKCQKKLPYCINLSRCKSCGKPIEETDSYCHLCRKHTRPPFAKICAPYLYNNLVKKSIVRFKQERYQSYAKVFARDMAAILAYDCPDITFDAVISVPPRKRLFGQNGYNQAECLAQAVAVNLQIPLLAGVLKQKKRRKKQSSLGAKERWKNAAGNVSVTKPKTVQGKTLLLVDDVTTTGATLYACSLALKQQGAAKIYCLTAATTEKGV